MSPTLTRPEGDARGAPVQSRPVEPAEALIPEARERQRARYRRRAAVILIAVALVVALLVFLVSISRARGSSAARGPGDSGVAQVAATRPVLVRPILCFTPGAEAGARPSPSLPASCPSPFAVSANSVRPQPAEGGTYAVHVVPDDGDLTSVASTARDMPDRVVLLPFADVRRGRALLGPSVLQLSRSSVRSVTIVRGSSHQWTVHLLLTAEASVRLDRVAQHAFHTYLALDLGGMVVADPLVEPAQASFSSLNGRLDLVGSEIGGLDGRIAQQLSASLRR